MSTAELKTLLSKSHRFPTNQIELSFIDTETGAKRVLKDDETVSSVVPLKTPITLKNLGKQISWKTVFLVEYAGPLIIFPLLSLITRGKGHDSLQNTLFWMVIIHFAKREF
jgi:very-long-chain enoyl-CoA reductase